MQPPQPLGPGQVVAETTDNSGRFTAVVVACFTIGFAVFGIVLLGVYFIVPGLILLAVGVLSLVGWFRRKVTLTTTALTIRRAFSTESFAAPTIAALEVDTHVGAGDSARLHEQTFILRITSYDGRNASTDMFKARHPQHVNWFLGQIVWVVRHYNPGFNAFQPAPDQ